MVANPKMELFKQKIKIEYLILVLLFLFVLGFRLYFAFHIDHFNTDAAYFQYKHIESIIRDKALLFYDPLSYGGRYVLYPPLFHIVLALLSFGSVFMLKLIPEIFISLNVIIVYLIAKDISGNKYTSLFSALLASFYPILFSETLNNLSIYTLVIPLLLLMIYSMLNLDNKNYLWIFIICSFLLPLIHPSALVFVVTIFLYFLLLAGGAITPTKLKKEAAVFSILLIVLIEFIIYKKAFLDYGLNVLWQNVPSNILADIFRKLVPIDLALGVGILPLILGCLGIYISFMKEKKKIDYMFAAFSIAILLLIVLRFLTLSIGLMFLGLVLCIFTSSALSFLYGYINKLKFESINYFFTILLIIIFVFSSLVPSFVAAKESSNIGDLKVKEVKWIDLNTKPDDVILGNVEEGNLISGIGNRKNVIDNSFLLAPDPLGRNRDIEIIYTTVSEAIATGLIKKYSIKVIYLSDQTRDIYKIDGLKYAESSPCFDKLRNGRYYVFKC